MRDDDDVVGCELVPPEALAGGSGGDGVLNGVGAAFFRLEIAEAALGEVGVDEGIVNQLGEHEDAPVAVFEHRLVCALDGVFHAKAESEMAGQDVVDGAEVEDDGRRGGAFLAAGHEF